MKQELVPLRKTYQDTDAQNPELEELINAYLQK
jgi:hypothetical protein